MVFSIGNLLTLVVVLVILVIYRQIDSSNRSIEKVKKYADKLTQKLSSFVDEKTKEVKDFSIELQVNLKTGRELLKRVTTVEDTLNSRAGEIDRIKGRLSEYDGVLKELVNMSERVDENLKRLREEAAFVDTVGKQIREMGDHLDRLETETQSVQSRLEDSNRESIESLKQEYTDRMDAVVEELRGEMHATEDKVQGVSSYIDGVEAQMVDMQKESVNAVKSALEHSTTEANETHSRFLSEFAAGMRKLLGEAEAKGKTLVEQAQNDLEQNDKKLSEMREEVLQLMDKYKSHIVSIESEHSEKLRAQRQLLEETARKGVQLEDEAFAALKDRIGKDEIASREQLDTLEKQLAATSALERDLSERMKRLHEDVELKAQEVTTRIETFAINFSTQVDKSSESLQSGVLEKVEQRIEEYETSASYRFEKLEDVNVDIHSLDKNLRDLMDKTNGKLHSELEKLAETNDQARKVECEKNGEQLSQFRQELQDLGIELSDLRDCASRDLSAGLKGFEEQFQAKLAKTNTDAEQQLTELQENVDQRLLEAETNYAAEREETEQKYLRQLREQVEGLRENTRGELERLETGVSEFRNNVSEGIANSEQDIQLFQEAQRAEIEKAQQEALDQVEQEIVALRDTTEGDIRKLGREIDVKLKELAADLDLGRKELLEVCQVTRSEVTVWEGRVSQQLNESAASLSERISSLESEIGSAMVSMKDDFSSQRDDLIVSTNEERIGLKNELTGMSERVDELKQELQKLTDTSMAELRRELEMFQIEYQKRMRDFSADSDQKMKDHRGVLAEIRDRAETLEKKLFGKTEESYRLLNVNLDQVDRRIKNFVAQTKVFERADTLKLALENDIDGLQTEIAKVRLQRKEVDETAAQIQKTKRVAEETVAKTRRFFSEKHQIEDMEENFKKLLELSRAMEMKLDTIYASNDALQEIQAKVRALEDAGKIVESRYERLEKKKDIIDSTTEAIDKNFTILGDLETNMKTLQGVVSDFSTKVGGLESKYETISEQKVKADAVVESLGRIDGFLGKVEERMGQLQTAREWLARTETRMESVGKQAQEQVRLLETLIQSDTAQEKPERGAPPLDKRETVIKLKHQGWTVQEIARATKLSRGEIELILEVAPHR